VKGQRPSAPFCKVAARHALEPSRILPCEAPRVGRRTRRRVGLELNCTASMAHSPPSPALCCVRRDGSGTAAEMRWRWIMNNWVRVCGRAVNY
jgi:hypothetical protein